VARPGGREARRQIASAWGLVAALVVAVLVACADEAPNKDWGRGVYIGEDWSVARAVNGHRLHVVKRKIACVSCHSMTGEEIGPVKPERCATCHEKEARISHAPAMAAEEFGHGTKADCTACHAFTLEGTGHDEALRDGGPPRVRMDGGTGAYAFGIAAYSPSDCKRCHQAGQGKTPAVVAHGTQPCLTCHQPHGSGETQSAPCSDCHQNTTTHASKGKTLVETCSTCHQHRHAPAAEAVATCAACHATQKPLVPPTALFENGGHTECTSCHQPHDFEKSKATPCKNCHEDLNMLGGARIAAHNTCTSCHSPHDVKGSPAAACATCHKSVHPDHPKQGTAGTCVGCHDPHPNQARADTSARACTSCHSFVNSDHGAHGKAACTDCHKPHGFELALSNHAICSGCHSQRVQQVSTNQGHQACLNCHKGLPHRPVAAEVGCETCHEAEHGKANAGHQKCTQCHEPHSGAQAAPCASCHKKEHQTAPAGHQQCTNCHEPHAGLPAQKTCSECHAAERASAHGQIAKGCLTCHRPHGPDGTAKPPACATCHDIGKLPGLHTEARHRACERCHSGHDAKNATDRQACVSCHTDRKEHFPNSPRCSSCHLFTQAH